MMVNNPPTYDHIFDTEGNELRVKVLEIGGWDMNADATKNVNHGLGANWTNIVHASVTIINDAEDDKSVLPGLTRNPPSLPAGYITSINSLRVVLGRAANAIGYDNTSYDDDTINRGHVMIWYLI